MSYFPPDISSLAYTMLSLSLLLMTASALSSPITTDYCKGHDIPIPLSDRQHRGLILASTIEELGQPLEEWEREMTEVAWKVAFFDDGYLDDGQTFQFVSTFPSHVSETYSPVQNVDLELSEDKREAWLDLLKDSKFLVCHFATFWSWLTTIGDYAD
jgi:hypothetical protein